MTPLPFHVQHDTSAMVIHSSGLPLSTGKPCQGRWHWKAYTDCSGRSWLPTVRSGCCSWWWVRCHCERHHTVCLLALDFCVAQYYWARTLCGWHCPLPQQLIWNKSCCKSLCICSDRHPVLGAGVQGSCMQYSQAVNSTRNQPIQCTVTVLLSSPAVFAGPRTC